jgi:hypothetical protein
MEIVIICSPSQDENTRIVGESENRSRNSVQRISLLEGYVGDYMILSGQSAYPVSWTPLYIVIQLGMLSHFQFQGILQQTNKSPTNDVAELAPPFIIIMSREIMKDENETLIFSEIDHDRCNILRNNFIMMSVAFATNHGCVVACLAYATTQLGDLMGGYGSGVLYVCYAVTSFLLSKPVVSMIGPKSGLLLGVGGYCVYVGGFLIAIMLPVIAWPAFMIACAVGGIAGGFLWTAQGRYFSGNARLYADVSRLKLEEANSLFAGIFATSYLGLECITKALATIIFLNLPQNAPFVIFTIYTVLSVLSVFVVARLDDLKDYGTWSFNSADIFKNVYATGHLIVSDSRLALLVPFQVRTLVLSLLA